MELLQEEQRLSCTSHDEEAIGYCKVCKVLICHSCSCCCNSHDIKSFEDCQTTPEAGHHYKFRHSVSKLEEDLKNKFEQGEQELQWLEERAALLSKSVSDPESHISSVLAKREEIIRWIREQQLEISSLCIYNWCNEIVAGSPCDEDIWYEFNTWKDAFERVKGKIAEMKRFLKSISQIHLMTQWCSQNPEEDNPTYHWMMKQTYRECRREVQMVNCHIDEFVGFDNPLKIPEIREALVKQLSDAGNGIMVGGGVEVTGIPVDICNIVAGISPGGWLVLSTNFNSNIIMFTNLITKEKFDFKAGLRFSTPYFYKDKVFLMSHRGRWMYNSTMSEVIEKKSMKAFGKTKTSGCWNWGDNTKTSDTGYIRYATVGCSAKIYDVVDKSEKPLLLSAGEILSTTGIDMGEYDFVYKFNGTVYAHTVYNKSRAIANGVHIGIMLFPSNSHPEDPSKGLLMCQDTSGSVYFHYLGQRVDLHLPFEYEPFISILRVYRDVFLVYDKADNVWKYVRVVVP